ncbi:hypothetical protein Hanom_Chr14g01261891 [Helianthus anomalus]
MFHRKTKHSIKKNNSLMLVSIRSIRKVAMVALLMKLLMQFGNFLLQPSNICFRNSNLLQLRSRLHFKGI